MTYRGSRESPISLRAVIYARYSTDEQRPESIEDQIETCRRFCAAKGWKLVGVYSDAAMSGSTAERPDYERLKDDAKRAIYDIVVVEAIDRMSRRLSEVAAFHDALAFRGQKLFACDRGEISPLMAGILGAIGQSFLEDLRTKTKRGLRGKVLAGLAAGGLGYGYEVDPAAPGLRRIVPEQATIITRIFTMYAAGSSPRQIARTLNKENVPGPGGRTWVDTTIRGQVDRGTGILNNAAYVGRLEWNRCSYVRDPASGRRVARPNPREAWEITEVPGLRIIDDVLWEKVKKHQEEVRTEMRRDEHGQALNRAHRAKHFLSGLIVCGECGEPYAMRNAQQYGCRNHRSGGVCTNGRMINKLGLEKVIVDAIRHNWMTTSNMEELYAELESSRQSNRDATAETRRILTGRSTRTRDRIERLVSAIAEAGHSKPLLDKLRRLEAEALQINLEMNALDEDSSPPVPFDRAAIDQFLTDLCEKLPLLVAGATDSATIADLRTKVRRMIDRIVVEPGADDEVPLTIHGKFAGVMHAAGLLHEYREGTQTAPEAGASGAAGSVVAGTGFEPVTFRL